MKILLVHNYYGSSAPSGENRVFKAEKALLERSRATRLRFAHVIRMRYAQAGRFVGYGGIKGALCTVGNPFAAHETETS